MAAEIETGSKFTREKPIESALNKMDELPNMVQCGTIEDLLHCMAPQHVHTGKPQCWEDAWQQILQAVGSVSLPQNMSCEEPQLKGLDVPQENAKAGLEQPNVDTSVSPEILSTFSLPPKNTWMLHFQVDDDIEAYLETFEWVAHIHHWSKEEWVARLMPYLSHKALLAYSVFCHEMAHTYDAVKESILCQYGITPETQRQAFRGCQYLETEGPREACQKLRILAQRWLKPEKHTKEQILELLILEQFLTILPQEMQSWVRECNPQTCAQAVEIAEGFQLRNEPPVPFEDVCVKFSEEEWTFLTEKQRALYRDVTLENFQTICTMGIPFEKPEVIRQIEEKRTPCFQDDVPREDPQENPFTGVSLDNLEIFEQIQEQGTLFFQDDAPREDSQKSLLSGVSMEKLEIFEQIQKEGTLSFQDDAPREDSQKSPLSDNAQLPHFNRHSVQKKIVSKKAEMDVEEQPTATEVTQHHLDSVGATNVAFPSSKKQLPQCLKHSTAKKSPVKSHSPKKQGSAPKSKARKRKKQQLPPVGEPNSGRKQLQPPLTGKTSGGLESDTTISVSKNLKQKKGGGSQDGPSKLKKQLVSTGESPKLTNKKESQDEVPRLNKEPQLEKKASLQNESSCQQGKEQPMTMPLPLKAGPHKSVLSVFTWYPPFCATVLSDLTCPECGRTFRQRGDLRHHKYVHTQEKPYACTVCNKHFRHPSNLQSHLRTHSGEKPHQCPDCGKMFSQSSNLRTHRQIHSGTKPFSCCICGKTFRHRSNLTIHERMHTGERPYPCSICGKRFADRSTMVQHERIHTGEKPYACNICEQKFSQISHLTKHCRLHPGARGPTNPKSSEVHSLSLPKIVSHSPRGKTPSE